MNICLTILEQVCLYTPLIISAYVALSLMQLPFIAVECAFVAGGTLGGLVALFMAQQSVLSLVGSLFFAMMGGAIIGVAMALCMFTRAQLPALLSSIVVSGAGQAALFFMMGGSHITLPSSSSSLRLLPFVDCYPELLTVLIIALCTTIGILLFLKTRLGISCALFGNNPAFLRHHGISVLFVVSVGLGVSGALAAVSGFCIAQSQGFIDVASGFGIFMLAITALVLGKASTSAKLGPLQPHTALVGILMYFLMQHGLILAGMNHRYFSVVQAVVVVVYFFFFVRSRHASQDLGI